MAFPIRPVYRRQYFPQFVLWSFCGGAGRRDMVQAIARIVVQDDIHKVDFGLAQQTCSVRRLLTLLHRPRGFAESEVETAISCSIRTKKAPSNSGLFLLQLSGTPLSSRSINPVNLENHSGTEAKTSHYSFSSHLLTFMLAKRYIFADYKNHGVSPPAAIEQNLSASGRFAICWVNPGSMPVVVWGGLSVTLRRVLR
jgi:hypothetical protein